MQETPETQVQSLGREDPLDEEMATHSSILVWVIPWTENKMTLDSVLKSRDITLPTNTRVVRVTVFPVVTYGCDSWTIKMAEHLRIGAFKLWCWRRLLRVLWRGNQSILKEVNPKYSCKGLMLKLQYFSHLMRTANSLEKTLILRKIEGRRWREWQRIRCLDIITDSMDMSLSKHQGIVEGQGSLVCFCPWGCKELDTTEQWNMHQQKMTRLWTNGYDESPRWKITKALVLDCF